jgi:hypothetical protein
MLGTATESVFQLDRAMLYRDNVGVGCDVPRFVNPVAMERPILTARLVNGFCCSQAMSIDAGKGFT